MHIERDRFGEPLVVYDSREEEDAAIGRYLGGDFAALTCEEVAQFRACEEDPYGIRAEAEHAGELVDVTEMELNGVLFVYFPVSEPLEASRAKLLGMVGSHPITPLELWRIARRRERAAAAAAMSAQGGPPGGRPLPVWRSRGTRDRTVFGV